MDEVMYCEKCGFIGHILFSKQCKHCKTKMKILSEDMKYKYHIFVEDWVEISKEEIAPLDKLNFQSYSKVSFNGSTSSLLSSS